MTRHWSIVATATAAVLGAQHNCARADEQAWRPRYHPEQHDVLHDHPGRLRRWLRTPSTRSPTASARPSGIARDTRYGLNAVAARTPARFV